MNESCTKEDIIQTIKKIREMPIETEPPLYVFTPSQWEMFKKNLPDRCTDNEKIKAFEGIRVIIVPQKLLKVED